MKTRIKRYGARLAWMIVGSVLTMFTVYVLLARSIPDIEAWHRADFEQEYRERDRARPGTFEGYLALEDRLFAELSDVVLDEIDLDAPEVRLSRFHPQSEGLKAEDLEHDWNRTVELAASPARGVALLIHGLSDSPYSLRRVAEILHDDGFHVIIPRMPGHGVAPGGLADVRWRDWTGVVRLCARRLAEVRGGGELPFVVGGYSNGAALAVRYALDSLDDQELPTPTRLLMFSPALAVTRLAALAGILELMSHVPFLEKLAWQTIMTEFDPYKFNSFPLNAARQIRGLTKSIDKEIGRRCRGGAGIDGFPPVMAFASLVDATVPVSALFDRLLEPLGDNGSEVVLFDVNRVALMRAFLLHKGGAMLERLEASSTPYSVTLITNRDDSTVELVARSREANAPADDWQQEELGLAWSGGIYSLSHVALPFRSDDPIYGVGMPGKVRTPTLGNLEPRGERATLGVSASYFLRVRFNPFFEYVEERIRQRVNFEAGR